MTREEAIQELEETNTILKSWGGFTEYPQALYIAIEMAIEALKDRPQGDWIPCSERLPSEFEAVNVTWVNHNPPMYYQYTKEVPNVDTAVNYKGVWYWWDSTICDVLAEYGEECGAEPIDKDIEVLAWQPLPKPYKGGDDE